MRRDIETTDLFRGAFLLCRGGQLHETLMRPDGQVRFVITGSEVADEDMKFRTGQALVNPLQLRETRL